MTVLQEACIIPDEESGKTLGLLREGNFSVSRPVGRRRFREGAEKVIFPGTEVRKEAGSSAPRHPEFNSGSRKRRVIVCLGWGKQQGRGSEMNSG